MFNFSYYIKNILYILTYNKIFDNKLFNILYIFFYIHYFFKNTFYNKKSG